MGIHTIIATDPLGAFLWTLRRKIIYVLAGSFHEFAICPLSRKAFVLMQ